MSAYPGEGLDEYAARDLINEDFKRWREERERALARQERMWHLKGREDFVNAYARLAHLAEYKRDAMGLGLAQAQARISRRRKANRQLVEKLDAALQELERLKRAGVA